MSGIGRRGGGSGPIPPAYYPNFDHELFVGEGFTSVKNAFTDLDLALAYLNALPPDQQPNEFRKFLIHLSQGFRLGQNRWIPDWVWIDGKGHDNTHLISDTDDGDYILSIGHGGLRHCGVIAGLFGGPGFDCLVHIRDTASLHSPLKEPFAVVGGETLVFKVEDGPEITVTLAAGDTTAAAVAARIMALGDPTLVAGAQYGRVRVRGLNTIADPKLELTGTGTGNVLFGWPASGAVTQVAEFAELRVLDDVFCISGGRCNTNWCIRNDDVTFGATTFNNIRIDGLAKGVRFAGGSLNITNNQFRGTDIGLDLYNDGISPAGVQNVVLFNTEFADYGPTPATQIRFNHNNIVVFSGGNSYNPQKVNYGPYFGCRMEPYTSAGVIKFADQYAFMGPAWEGRNAEDAINQVFAELRNPYSPVGIGNDIGIVPAILAPPASIDNFETREFKAGPQDNQYRIPVKLPPVAAIGNRSPYLVLHIIHLNTGGTGIEEVKFTVDIDKALAGEQPVFSETVTWQDVLLVGHKRQDIVILLDVTKIAPDLLMTLLITRMNTFAPAPGNVKYASSVYLVGTSVRL